MITNLVNGKKYVGITTRTAERRWRDHCSAASKGFPLASAIKKYGKENFSIHVLASAKTRADLMALEVILIAQEGTLSPGGYNQTTGGEASYAWSEESRAKISRSKTGLKPSEAARINMSIAGRKKPKRSAETRKLLSDAHKSKPKSPEHKAALSKGRAGMRLTEKHRANIGAALIGGKRSEGTKTKMRISKQRILRTELNTLELNLWT